MAGSIYDDDADPLPPRYSRSASSSRSRSTPTTKAPRAHSPDRRSSRHPPRESLYVKKYVDLDEYAKDFRSFRLANLTMQDKIHLYGSPVAPIFVPLARGESIADYEARFDEWLARKGLTRRQLETDPDPRAERNEWYEFAYANAKGKEKYDPTKSSSKKRARSSEREEPPTKKTTHETTSVKVIKTETKPHTEKASKRDSGKAQGCTMVSPPENAPRTEVIAAYVACGCQRCLLKGIWHMARKVSEVEAKISSPPLCSCGQSQTQIKTDGEGDKAQVILDDDRRQSPRPIVSLSRPSSASASTTKEAAAITKLVLSRPSPADLVAMVSTATIRRDPVVVDEDPVEKQLASQYDEINEQVIMNENVLEASAARLASTPVTDIEETTRLQDENLELRGFVQEEVENRNAALAMLVVYLWRHDRGSLEKMIGDSGVSDVVHVQRMGHQKCELLAKQIAEKGELAASIKRQLDAAMDSDEDDVKRLTRMAELGTDLGTAESDVRTLRSQRQREFATLVHFDGHLRLLIKTLLETAAQ